MALPLLSAAGNFLTSRGAFFLYGAVSAPLVAKAANPVAQLGRSLLKGSIKGALVVGSTLQNAVTEAKDSISDVTAEVRADIAKADEVKQAKAEEPVQANAAPEAPNPV